MQSLRDIDVTPAAQDSDPTARAPRGTPSETSIRVLLADDDPGILDTLGRLVDAEESMELVGTAGGAEEAANLAAVLRPDVAVVDVRMPGGGGPRAARAIRACSPRTRVLDLSAFHDPNAAPEGLGAGPGGYMTK